VFLFFTGHGWRLRPNFFPLPSGQFKAPLGCSVPLGPDRLLVVPPLPPPLTAPRFADNTDRPFFFLYIWTLLSSAFEQLFLPLRGLERKPAMLSLTGSPTDGHFPPLPYSANFLPLRVLPEKGDWLGIPHPATVLHRFQDRLRPRQVTIQSSFNPCLFFSYIYFTLT